MPVDGPDEGGDKQETADDCLVVLCDAVVGLAEVEPRQGIAVSQGKEGDLLEGKKERNGPLRVVIVLQEGIDGTEEEQDQIVLRSRLQQEQEICQGLVPAFRRVRPPSKKGQADE